MNSTLKNTAPLKPSTRRIQVRHSGVHGKGVFAIQNIAKGKYTQTIVDNLFRLDEEKGANLKKTFFLDGEKYLIQKEEISQPSENRKLEINYSDIKTYNQGTIPTAIAINAVQPKGTTNINLNYNNISFNEELSFPYSVPSGYKKVTIK